MLIIIAIIADTPSNTNPFAPLLQGPTVPKINTLALHVNIFAHGDQPWL